MRLRAAAPAGIALLCAALLGPALLGPALLGGCSGDRDRDSGGTDAAAAFDPSAVYDHHVHVLSPALVERWKSLGVPFSKPDHAYSDIDSILSLNPAGGMSLVSMAYLWAVDGFSDSAERSRVAAENDFTAALARRHPGRLRAFCGVHPLRDYAADEVRRARRDGGMEGLKLHFGASEVDLRDPGHLARVRALFALASSEGMPVLLHLDNQSDAFLDEDAGLLIDSLLLPGPPVELILAHFGTSGGFGNRTRAILRRFIGALRDEPGLSRHTLRFDISAVALVEPAEQVPALTPEDFADLSGMLVELGLNRVVFGTDYPVFNTRAYLETLEKNLGLTREELMRIAGNGRPGARAGVRPGSAGE